VLVGGRDGDHVRVGVCVAAVGQVVVGRRASALRIVGGQAQEARR